MAGFIQKQIMKRMQMEKQDKARRFAHKNQFVKKGQILFAGSSLMEQFPIDELQHNYHIDKVIYNRGIGGFVIPEFKANIKTCVYDLEPSRIFLNIGTNDMTVPDFVMEDFIASYEEVIQMILDQLPGVELYLMAYYPVNPEAASKWMKKALEMRSNKRILEVNEEVKKLAEKLGVRYIDVNKNLFDDQGRQKAEFTIDGMHMYANGYAAIMDDLVPYINEPAWK